MLEIETQQELEERDDGLLEIYAMHEYHDQALLLQNINETCHGLSRVVHKTLISQYVRNNKNTFVCRLLTRRY